MGVYVYAISGAEKIDALLPEGILDQPAYQVRSGALSAIVSDCPVELLRAERRHLSAHQRMLGAANAQRDLLPMAFGTITESTQLLEAFLDEHADTLSAQLQRVAGTEEMALRLALDFPDPIAYLVERSPDLKAARERMFSRRREPSYDEKIRLGQLCGEVLARYRETQTARVLGMIEASCKEIMALPLHGEQEVANWAMLVPRESRADFEATVEEAAARCEEDLVFQVAGPWPPHNFVELALT